MSSAAPARTSPLIKTPALAAARSSYWQSKSSAAPIAEAGSRAGPSIICGTRPTLLARADGGIPHCKDTDVALQEMGGRFIMTWKTDKSAGELMLLESLVAMARAFGSGRERTR